MITAFAGLAETSAQFSDIWAPDRVYTDEPANLFAVWEGEEDIDGLLVTAPLGWDVPSGHVVTATGRRVSLSVSREDNGTGHVVSGLPSGSYTVILNLRAGQAPGTETWSVVPWVEEEDTGRLPLDLHRMFLYTLIEEPLPEGGRTALSFSESDRMLGEEAVDAHYVSFDHHALLLNNEALPDLGAEAPYTFSFWMQTTGLDEVVFSTWDGREESAYPFELMVDGWGHLRYYRGEPGRHESMTTREPVADGQWNHFAITHDPETRWSRLMRNGVAVDSLYTRVPDHILFTSSLAVGSRMLVDETRDRQRDLAFSGRLASVHIWPEARSIEQLRADKRRARTLTREPSSDQPIFLEFSEPIPTPFLDQSTAHARRIVSSLILEEPLRHLQADLEEEGVRLSWEGDSHLTEAFVVERSIDGVIFDRIGQVLASPSIRDDDESAVFHFVDDGVAGQVVYYRVNRLFRGGQEHSSGILKLGLGDATEEGRNALLGNFPNPFREDTTIAFELFRREHVRLSVWDLTGQQVTLLLDETTDPGYHEVSFDGSDFPSGTYFVRLETGDEQQTHAMILTK